MNPYSGRAVGGEQSIIEQSLKAAKTGGPSGSQPRYLQDPANRAQTIHLTAKRYGRNEKCPCGSGKKVKACHKHVFKHDVELPVVQPAVFEKKGGNDA